MKKILLILLLFPLSFVFAQEANLYFYSEGATSSSTNIEISENIISLKNDGSYYTTYDMNAVITNINKINNELFYIYKNGSTLVDGQEWYAIDENEKKHYFSQSKSYLVSDIVKELGLQNDSFIMVNLHANWQEIKDYNEQINVNKVTLDKKNLSLKTKESYQLIANIDPKDADNKKITWTSSDKNIVSVDSIGVIKGLKKGTATITATSANGKKDTCVVTVGDKKVKYVHIQYNTNGGTLDNKHGKNISEKKEYIYVDGKKDVQNIPWDEKIPNGNLIDYNNQNHVNIVKKGYSIVKGSEWNTKKDGTGKSYSQTKAYKASDFCDASKKDCTIVLYANWKKNNSLIKISYDINNGQLANPHGENISTKGTTLSWKNGTTQTVIQNNGSLNSNGLPNYDNPTFFNIVREGYKAVKGAEWNTKPDGTGKSYSQSKSYKASDFCSSTCDITLYVNWQKEIITNDIDLVLLWGQSNMVGHPAIGKEKYNPQKDTRTLDSALYNDSNNPYDDDIIANYKAINVENYYIDSNTAWEYKYNTNELIDLYNNGKNLIYFGEDIKSDKNTIVSKESYGTNMVPYFAKAYTGETKHKLAIIHYGVGGKQIECFLPMSDKDHDCKKDNDYMYEYMVMKYKSAVKLLQKKGYTIKNKFYVVLQGAANSNANRYANYYDHFMKVHKNLKKDLGIEFGGIMYTWVDPSKRNQKPKCEYNDKVHAAHVKLIKNNKDIMLASDWGYKRYTEGYKNAFSLPKHDIVVDGTKYTISNNTNHLTSAGLSKGGVEAALNVSKKVLNKNYDTSYTGYTKNCS